MACAALLRDSIEDHAENLAPGTGHQAAFAVLSGQFEEWTAGLVAAVTNPLWESAPGRARAASRARRREPGSPHRARVMPAPGSSRRALRPGHKR